MQENVPACTMAYFVRLLTFITLLVCCPKPSYGQTTAFNSFAGVSVADHVPVIPEGSQKVFTTSVKLRKNSGVTFMETTFSEAARRFYTTAFVQGFLSVSNVRKTDLTSPDIQVTYDVTYIYPLLFLAVDGSDSAIEDRIGTFSAVRRGLNEQANILSFYPVANDDSTFSFSGSPICTVAQCNGTYVACIETTSALTATCVSQCKNEYCYNGGLCFHSNRNIRPECRCPTYPDLWILGDRCETKFPLWLAVLLAVIGLLIILLVIFITVLCVRKKRRRLAKKQALLNTAPQSHVNPGFLGDDIRMPVNGTIQPRNESSVQRRAPGSVDSFETVTSSEMPPSEYRPRTTDTGRNRNRPNGNTSTSSHDTDRRHHRRGLDRSRRSSSELSKDGRKKHTKNSASSVASSSSDEDHSNISYYEVNVDDADLHSETASSEVAVSTSTKTSPIKWIAPKSDEPRAGWVPSLGPLMYDLPTQGNRNTSTPESELERRRTRGTDV